MGKIGGVDDRWGAEEARRAWMEVSAAGVSVGAVGEVLVKAEHRYTLERERVENTLRDSGLDGGLGATSYVFCECPTFPLPRHSNRRMC